MQKKTSQRKVTTALKSASSSVYYYRTIWINYHLKKNIGLYSYGGLWVTKKRPKKRQIKTKEDIRAGYSAQNQKTKIILNRSKMDFLDV